MHFLDIEYKDGSIRRKWINGGRCWFDKYSKHHRDNDLSAIIYANGTKEWCKHGKRHRDNDLPAIIYANGNKYWYKNGNGYTL